MLVRKGLTKAMCKIFDPLQFAGLGLFMKTLLLRKTQNLKNQSPIFKYLTIDSNGQRFLDRKSHFLAKIATNKGNIIRLAWLHCRSKLAKKQKYVRKVLAFSR